MKNLYGTLILSATLLSACGDNPNSSEPHVKAAKGHFFSQPYECTHEADVTSKRTGETRTVKYRSHYSPQKGWRIDLTDVEAPKAGLGGRGVANLYTPSTRYDGIYRDKEGLSISFKTAWPRKTENADIALSNLSKKRKKNCKVLTDLSVFDIDYLDSLQVMGQ